ncbi:hypothetical protein Hypma_004612 [Hypsizygus marmoreus]|uniref:BTB domain-containing protein n=1 Tax=Hypsizygus marmoreus TaxID=39966 RepID=A0A369K0N3_HYPMA|nr:hypothetical protein Hypma_004612 [Hypsizygus marmoreus]
MSTRNPTGPPALNNPRVSERFSDTDADITIQASDGTLFRVHTMNLRATTEGLSPPPCATLDQVVQLTEDSATLDLLFQFMYPSRHPDLEDVHFNLLEHVAEAAEKYQVYPAMNMCKVRMKNQLSQYPDAVMLYAMRHGYPEIMDKAAPRVIAQTLYKTVAKMPPRYIVPWHHIKTYETPIEFRDQRFHDGTSAAPPIRPNIEWRILGSQHEWTTVQDMRPTGGAESD